MKRLLLILLLVVLGTSIKAQDNVQALENNLQTAYSTCFKSVSPRKLRIIKRTLVSLKKLDNTSLRQQLKANWQLAKQRYAAVKDSMDLAVKLARIEKRKVLRLQDDNIKLSRIQKNLETKLAKEKRKLKAEKRKYVRTLTWLIIILIILGLLILYVLGKIKLPF